MVQLALVIQVSNTRERTAAQDLLTALGPGRLPGFSCLIYGLMQVGQLVTE